MIDDSSKGEQKLTHEELRNVNKNQILRRSWYAIRIQFVRMFNE